MVSTKIEREYTEIEDRKESVRTERLRRRIMKHPRRKKINKTFLTLDQHMEEMINDKLQQSTQSIPI